ncbi:Uncharacterised protein [Mycobacteroides abscessus]|nr:Uncharacterised protein [Mycobacteroides abscessus]CPU70454.1 Uncharacterised protein [Mycobacteroides abscessus]
MKHYSKLSTAITAVALTAATTAAPALADPETCTVYGPNNTMTCTPLAPTTTAPSTSSGSSGGGLMGWIDSHIGTLIFIGLAIFAIAVWRTVAKEKVEKNEAALARGRRIAENWYATRVAAARFDAAAQIPDRSVYDPHGLGLAPPPAPSPKPVNPPPMETEDLQRYAAFGAVVPWDPNSAFGACVTRSGSVAPAETAWTEAMRAANLGETDTESGAFTPAATLVSVHNVVDSGDAELHVRTAGVHVREEQLNRVRAFLIPAARVASVSPFEWKPATGLYLTRLSMETAAAPTTQNPALAPEQPRVDPRWS